jgi:hypothetical protein
MRKITCTLITTLLFSGLSLMAQDENHKNYYEGVDAIEEESYEITFADMVSKMDYNKFAFKLKNLTTDYLLLRKGESNFAIDGKEYKEKKKEIVIKPNKTKAGTFNVKGEEGVNYHTDEYTFNLDGIYLLPIDGEVHEAPNFDLPASKNEIKFGDFKVKLKKLKQQTQESVFAFEVTYLGNDYAVVDPTKLAVMIPSKGDKEFANDARGAAAILLKKGKKVQFKAVFHIPAKYADMQFAEMEVLWRDMFQTSVPVKFDTASIDFELDKKLTAEKNR